MSFRFCALASFFSVVSSLSAGVPSYDATELPWLDEGFIAAAFAINESGVVVGQANSSIVGDGYPLAVVWTGLDADPITGAGFSFSASLDVNEAGIVVGDSDELFTGFVWDGGFVQSLQGIDGLFMSSQAWGINDRGLIVGRTGNQHAAVWVDGVSHTLPEAGSCCSIAYDVNNSDVIVGYASVEDRTVAVRWFRDSMDVVADLGGTAKAHGINDRGEIVGEASYPSVMGEFVPTSAFHWVDGLLTELESIGGITSRAYAINNHGDIVGTSAIDVTPNRAVMWRDGVIHDLNDLVVSGATDLTLVRAYDINDAGQIVGQTSDHRAFRLDPVETVPGDLDDDGAVAFGDLLILLAAWEESGPADLDGSGTVGFNDLLILLAAWGP